MILQNIKDINHICINLSLECHWPLEIHNAIDYFHPASSHLVFKKSHIRSLP